MPTPTAVVNRLRGLLHRTRARLPIPPWLTPGVLAVVLARGLPAQEGGLERASWLTGCWESRSANRVAQEVWFAPSGEVMVSVARSVVGGQFQTAELVLLRRSGGQLVYEASPTGQGPVSFPSIVVSDTLLVFENQEHDFPKRIGYARRGADSLLAWVEGGGRRIPYPYARARCDDVLGRDRKDGAVLEHGTLTAWRVDAASRYAGDPLRRTGRSDRGLQARRGTARGR